MKPLSWINMGFKIETLILILQRLINGLNFMHYTSVGPFTAWKGKNLPKIFRTEIQNAHLGSVVFLTSNSTLFAGDKCQLPQLQLWSSRLILQSLTFQP